MVRWLTVLGHFMLWLGVAFAEPGLSQPDRSAREQITATVIKTEQQTTQRNWHSFWRHHLGTWQGSWTRYTPDGEVKETFASTREFTANPAKTAILQTNRYRYADGRSIEKKWSYNIEDHNQLDGFAHPASVSMRGLALDNGAAAWLIPSLKANQFTPFELFLMDGDRRHSVGVLYGKNGELLRTASIREQRKGGSTVGWTDAILQVKPWHPHGQWKGQKIQILQDLSRVPAQNASWLWKDAAQFNQSNHFLPDRIILRCPERLTSGQAFSIEVIWMLNDDVMQTITAKYDKDAKLIGVTHQSLSSTDSPN
jgi:hypothetical protein